MKLRLNHIIKTLLLLIVSGLISCAEHNPNTESLVIKNLISRQWQIKSVTLDGVDITSKFNNLTLSFTQSKFETTNGGAVWPPSGTWSFDAGQDHVILRNDSLEMNIIDVTSQSLIISFTWSKTTYGGGRSSSLSGLYEFSFR